MPAAPEDAQMVSLSLSAIPANLTVVRQVLTGAALVAGLGDAELEDIKVAVTEACTNVIMHAYPNSSGAMEVGVWTSPSQIVVSVVDSGRGLAPASDRNREGLGLGMGLISALAQVVDVSSPPSGGTRVCMTFGSLNGEGPGPDDDPDPAA